MFAFCPTSHHLRPQFLNLNPQSLILLQLPLQKAHRDSGLGFIPSRRKHVQIRALVRAVLRFFAFTRPFSISAFRQ